ncbi:RasGEF domain [Rhizoctonia solani]|uniref:RasGEF domain n=1 Tax=Rhizoctonia solani TaxID=456999 RepID=A0A8H7I6Y2_9AGAM|nr:RasGEF domain [Rhizoctonia solani]
MFQRSPSPHITFLLARGPFLASAAVASKRFLSEPVLLGIHFAFQRSRTMSMIYADKVRQLVSSWRTVSLPTSLEPTTVFGHAASRRAWPRYPLFAAAALFPQEVDPAPPPRSHHKRELNQLFTEMAIYRKLRELIAKLISMADLPEPLVSCWDDLDTTIAEDCRFLIERALHLWRHAIVSNQEETLFCIDSALELAFNLDTKELGLRVQRLKNEAEALFQKAMASNQAYNHTLDQPEASDLESLVFPYHRALFVHNNIQRAVATLLPLIPSPLVESGHWIYVSKDEVATVKDILLRAYRSELFAYDALESSTSPYASDLSFGVLDNPTFHNQYSGLGCTDGTAYPIVENQVQYQNTVATIQAFRPPLVISQTSLPELTHVFLASNPRVHVLMNLDPQPQLYTLIKPQGLSQAVFKDQTGALHFFSDIWVRHNSYGHLDWTLYRLGNDGSQDSGLFELVPVKPVTKIEQTPWLIEIGKCSSPLTENVFYCTRKYISGVSSTAIRGLSEVMTHEAIELDSFVKNLGVLSGSLAKHNLDTDAIERSSKYDHPNVLPLDAIRLIPGNTLGLGNAEHRPTEAMHPDFMWAGLSARVQSGRAPIVCKAFSMAAHKFALPTKVHGNLRAATILVSLDGDALISDPFYLDDNQFGDRRSLARWMAPEVNMTETKSLAGDVYSLGMALVSSGAEYLLPDRPDDVMPRYRGDGNRLWTTLWRCWSFRPSDRPLASDVVEVESRASLCSLIPALTKLHRALWLPISDSLVETILVTLCLIVSDALSIAARAREEPYELSDPESELGFEVAGSPDQFYDFDEGNPTTSLQRTPSTGTTNYEHARDIIRRLARHGCENLTGHVNEASFSEMPVTGGGFGNVFCGNLLSGLPVSIKTPRICLDTLDNNPTFFEDVAREIHTWSRCHHPNIVNFLGLAVFRGQIGAVAPWMEHGKLTHYLKKKPNVNRCEVENIFVSGKGAIVVGDFGSSLLNNRSLTLARPEKSLCPTLRWSAQSYSKTMRQVLESPIYMRLEWYAVSILPMTEQDLTKSIDFARGFLTVRVSWMLIIWVRSQQEVMTGNIPWHWIRSEAAIIKRVCLPGGKYPRPDEIPEKSWDGDKFWNLLLACWSFESSDSPNAIEVKKRVSDSESRLIDVYL